MFQQLPNRFSSVAFQRIAHYNWLPFGYVLAAPKTFSKWVELAFEGLKCHWMIEWLHHYGLLSRVGNIPHSLVDTAPNQVRGHNGHTAPHQPAGNVAHVRQSCVFSYQTADNPACSGISISSKSSQPLLSLKGNVMCSISVRQNPHKYSETHN